MASTVLGFERALPPLLVIEGGKVDDPRDPGGRTNQGVIQRVYNAWRTNQGLPQRDVYKMENHERDAIYRVQFWDAIHGDDLREGVGYVVFDGAVHSGSKQSIKWLQRALGVTADGVIGQMTLEALRGVNDDDALITKILDRRLVFLQALKTWKTYGKGWGRRIADVKSRGQAWAVGSVGPAPTYIQDAGKKANIEDARKAPPKAPGDLGAAAGTVTGLGAGPLIDQAKTELGPLAAKLPFVNSVLFWLTVAGFIVAAGGLAWRFYAANQSKRLADALDT